MMEIFECEDNLGGVKSGVSFREFAESEKDMYGLGYLTKTRVRTRTFLEV